MADVVVINHDADVLDALETVIGEAGFQVATCFAQESVDRLAAFIREHDPRVVVYDLGPPPQGAAIEEWRALCQLPGADRRYVVTTTVTTTYACTLDPHPCMVERVLMRPTDLEGVTSALDRAIRTPHAEAKAA